MAKEDKKLSLDEMQDVAGGTIIETYLDGAQLKKWGADIKEIDCSNVREAFKNYGVALKDNGGLVNANEYRIDGKLVTRNEALQHVAKQLGQEYKP